MRQLRIAKQITNREVLSLDKYLNDISKIGLISAEEETALAVRIHEGDQMALEKMVKANLRFVVSVAKQYQNKGLTLGDLINEGNLGLVNAASRFDEKRGFKFISYAVWWIRQAIFQALAEQSRVVRLPLNKISVITQMVKESAKLEQKLEREPTAEELAEALDMDYHDVMKALQISKRHISIDAPFRQREDMSLVDIIEDEQADLPDSILMKSSLCIEIQRALSKLTSRESEIISLYYGLNGVLKMSLEDLSERFCISRERIRQIKETATRKLRHASTSKVLEAFI